MVPSPFTSTHSGPKCLRKRSTSNLGRLVALQPDHANVRKGAIADEETAEDRRHRVVDRDPLAREPSGQVLAGVNVERTHAGAVEQRRKQARDRAAEARRLQQAQAIFRPDPQRVRVPQDVVEHVAVAVDDALWPAGRPGSLEEVGERIARDLEPEIVLRETGIDPVEIQDLASRRRNPRREIPMRFFRQQKWRAGGGQHGLQARRRTAGIEADVELAGLEDAEDAGDQVHALAEEQTLRPPAMRRAARGAARPMRFDCRFNSS